MKLRKEDQDWFTSEIARIVKESHKDQTASHPQGMRRVMLWLKEWGAISALWAVPLTLLGMVITLAIFAFNGISKNAAFQATTESRLTVIDKRLDSIDRQLTKQTLTSQAALPLSDFKESLPILNSALTTARVQKVSIAPSVISNIQKKLLATKEATPGYWPVAAQLIYLRPVALIAGQDISAPCVGSIVITGGPAGPDMLGTATFSNCTMNLDKPDLWTASKSAVHVQTQQGEIVSNWHLRLHNVIVHYSGVQLNHVTEITFDHCILDFQFNQAPASPLGRSMTLQLLASTDFDKLEVKFPNG